MPQLHSLAGTALSASSIDISDCLGPASGFSVSLQRQVIGLGSNCSLVDDQHQSDDLKSIHSSYLCYAHVVQAIPCL